MAASCGITLSDKLQGGHKAYVYAIFPTKDDNLLSGDEDGKFNVWSLQDKKVRESMQFDDGSINSISCDMQGSAYVAAGDNVRVIDLRSPTKTTFTYNLDIEEINQITLNEKQNFLAACGDAGIVKILDIRQQKTFKTLNKHSNICTAVKFRPRRPWEMISVGMDCMLFNIDFSRSKCLRAIDISTLNITTTEDKYTLNPPLIHSADISQDGQTIACGLENSSICLFNSHKKEIHHDGILTSHTLGVSQVHFPACDIMCLLSGGNDGKLYVWAEQEEPAAVSKTHKLSTVPKHEFNHGSKINCINSKVVDGCIDVFVADQSSNISLYKIPNQ